MFWQGGGKKRMQQLLQTRLHTSYQHPQIHELHLARTDEQLLYLYYNRQQLGKEITCNVGKERKRVGNEFQQTGGSRVSSFRGSHSRTGIETLATKEQRYNDHNLKTNTENKQRKSLKISNLWASPQYLKPSIRKNNIENQNIELNLAKQQSLDFEKVIAVQKVQEQSFRGEQKHIKLSKQKDYKTNLKQYDKFPKLNQDNREFNKIQNNGNNDQVGIDKQQQHTI